MIEKIILIQLMVFIVAGCSAEPPGTGADTTTVNETTSDKKKDCLDNECASVSKKDVKSGAESNGHEIAGSYLQLANVKYVSEYYSVGATTLRLGGYSGANGEGDKSGGTVSGSAGADITLELAKVVYADFTADLDAESRAKVQILASLQMLATADASVSLSDNAEDSREEIIFALPCDECANTTGDSVAIRPSDSLAKLKADFADSPEQLAILDRAKPREFVFALVTFDPEKRDAGEEEEDEVSKVRKLWLSETPAVPTFTDTFNQLTVQTDGERTSFAAPVATKGCACEYVGKLRGPSGDLDGEIKVPIGQPFRPEGLVDPANTDYGVFSASFTAVNCLVFAAGSVQTIVTTLASELLFSIVREQQGNEGGTTGNGGED